ncbi:Gfo/Idh/MocA family oxidoreductase [Pseudarthrobacter sp. NPDC055928]|uniref:Gfo/Idh/MocA family oxidoreductase n=1 Tax=Pseudarthrobacter sp. NPDC055928 TaxID=3345661 RepID=UPI0035D896DC
MGHRCGQKLGNPGHKGGPQGHCPCAGKLRRLFAEFARAVRGDGPEPVPASEGIQTLEVLDAARRSAQEKVVIAL